MNIEALIFNNNYFMQYQPRSTLYQFYDFGHILSKFSKNYFFLMIPQFIIENNKSQYFYPLYENYTYL